MKVKQIGQFMGFVLGSLSSPSWILLGWVMRGYFNTSVITQGPRAVLSEILHYQTLVATNPTPIFTQLIPGMIGVLIFSSLYISVCGWLGGKIFPQLWQKAAWAISQRSAAIDA
jgi:hypothetical protein